MPHLHDQLEHIEHQLEQARTAGNQQAIHTLTTMHQTTLQQIHTTRLHRQPPTRTG